MLVEARKDAKDMPPGRPWPGSGQHSRSRSKRRQTAEGRTVFDAHRLTAYLTLGERALAIRCYTSDDFLST
jgi:hypothetical protein